MRSSRRSTARSTSHGTRRCVLGMLERSRRRRHGRTAGVVRLHGVPLLRAALAARGERERGRRRGAPSRRRRLRASERRRPRWRTRGSARPTTTSSSSRAASISWPRCAARSTACAHATGLGLLDCFVVDRTLFIVKPDGSAAWPHRRDRRSPRTPQLRVVAAELRTIDRDGASATTPNTWARPSTSRWWTSSRSGPSLLLVVEGPEETVARSCAR
jgi:hypothetical protein